MRHDATTDQQPPPASRKAPPMTESRVILDLTVALCAAFVGGYIAQRLKLPVLPGYLLVGVIISPAPPGFDAQLGTVQTVAELGVAFLMFSLGVDFHLKE